MKFIILMFVILWTLANYCFTGYVDQHKCRWDKCPYKGVSKSDSKDAIMWYTNAAPGSDAFKVDSLHMVNPSLDYDQIDSVLFTH